MMKILAFFCTLLFILISNVQNGEGKKILTPKPPLGWNSFDSYSAYLDEEAALQNLEAFAKKLKPHGYGYFVIDIAWYCEYALDERGYATERYTKNVNINNDGFYIPSKVYFPNGFDKIKKRCDELGVKFGVHMSRGVPIQGCEKGLKIKGTDITLESIADKKPGPGTGLLKYIYGVDMTKPGAQEWYNGLVQHLADMGVDFIKYDFIMQCPKEMEAVIKAVKNANKPIVLSWSLGPAKPDFMHLYTAGNMFRATGDIWDTQESIDKSFEAWHELGAITTQLAKGNSWLDLDMIPFGQLQLTVPLADKTVIDKQKRGYDPTNINDNFPGRGSRRWSEFDDAQKRTFITQRAMAASPLMVGGDLLTMDEFSLSLLTNPNMLACNQNGIIGHRVSENNNISVWKTPLKGEKTGGWIGVFNRSNKPAKFTVNESILNLSSEVDVYDIWNSRKISNGDVIILEANDVLFLEY